MMLKLAGLSSRSQYVLSLVSGMLAACAFAPLNFILAPFIAFPIWLYLLESAQQSSWKKDFALGWWFGLGYFTVGLYWITFSLGVDLTIFWWLIPLSLFGIPAALGVYVGTMAILLKFTHSTGISRCFWFAVLWTGAELSWGSGPLALPWNPLGSIWSSFDPILQSVSVFGIYGLTMATALLISFPILFRKYLFKTPQVIYVSGLFIAVASVAGWGLVRPANTPVQTQARPPLIRIVQPSIPQDLDWHAEKAHAQFMNLMTLSAQPAPLQPDIIVWPESALPLLLDEDQEARDAVAKILPANGHLISGSLRRIFDPGQKVKVYNSLMVVNTDAKVEATYDKHHLVPFGEYVPLRSVIPASITKVTSGEMDYSRGTGPETIRAIATPSFSPLICFEGIFSGMVIARGQPRPEWLLNITNDAWFGKSSGPYQHLQLARMRSIEEGLPLVRAANTGISAVFDAFGHEVARIELQEKGVVDVRLPPALQEPTLFATHGQVIFLLMILTFLGIGLYTRRH